MTYLLPDGGRLWETKDARRRKVGDRWFPSPVIYEHPGEDGGPGYRLVFEVWDGVPVCTEVRVTARPSHGVHVRPMHVKDVANRLEDCVHEWLALLGYKRVGPGKFVGLGRDDLRESRRVITSARRQTRRKMTGEHLTAVAEAYNAAKGGPGVEAVAAAFSVSERTAWRYIEKAREAGLLDG